MKRDLPQRAGVGSRKEEVRKFPLKKLCRSFDSSQGIFDLMGEACRQGPQCREPIRLPDRPFQFTDIGQVPDNQNDTDPLTAAHEEGRCGGADRGRVIAGYKDNVLVIRDGHPGRGGPLHHVYQDR